MIKLILWWKERDLKRERDKVWGGLILGSAYGRFLINMFKFGFESKVDLVWVFFLRRIGGLKRYRRVSGIFIRKESSEVGGNV